MIKRKSISPTEKPRPRLQSSPLLTTTQPGRSIERLRISSISRGSGVLILAFLLSLGNNIFLQREYSKWHIENNILLRREDLKWHIEQEAAINSKNNSDASESPQDPSPTSNMANQMLRSKGVLLRYDERHSPDKFTPVDQNSMNYIPASFVHASMQAPNVMFLGWPEEGEGWYERGPRVSYLIGSKFEPEAPMPSGDAPKVVDCRAYYPNDAQSLYRNYHIKDNPIGTSCLKIQKRFQNRFHDLYNVTNGCSCNYDSVPGKQLAKYFIDVFRKLHQVQGLQCWYPGSAEGIRNLIHASNSLFHNRVMLNAYQSYWGWTECSGSPNIQEPSMIDALVIHLPYSEKRANHDNSYFEDLDKKMTEKVRTILNRFAHLNLPVLLLQQKLGIDSEDCDLLWEGLTCEESYSKYFLSKELEFEDGSCLARAPGDDEVRFYQAGSYNCTVNRILHEHNPLWEMFRLKASQRNEALHDANDDDGTESLVLVLTGDIHGNFFPSSCQESRAATTKCTSSYGAPYLSHVLKTIRSVDKNTVLLDSGDAFFGLGEGGRPDMMELIADTMNLLQYNVMALGNHEPDYGPDALHKLRAMLQFPMIASNVKGPEAEALGIKPHIMIPIGKKNRYLCIVGVTAREVYPFVQNLTVTPEITSVFETLKNLPPSCDRRIILSHAGIDIDTELVERLASLSTDMPRIDAILGGHSHIFVPSNQTGSVPITERAPLLLHTNAYGRHVGLLRLVWNTTTNSLTNAQSEILPLDEVHGVYPDDDVNVTNLVMRKKAIDSSFQKQRSKERRFKFFGNEGDDEILECGESCRLGDCLLGQIITDSMRFCVESDHCFNGNDVKQNQENVIALLESGTVRSCFDADAQVFDDILPWPNKLVVLRVTGDKIVKFLQHGLSTTKKASTRGGGFLQVSGLRYNFTEDYQLIRESICLDDNRSHHNFASIGASCTKALESDKTYMMVVTDWLAAGGDGYGDLIEEATVLSVSKATIAEAVSFYRESHTDLTYHTASQFSRSFLVSEHQLSTRRIKLSSIYGIAGFIGGAISYMLTYPLYALFVKKAVMSRSTAKISWKLFHGVWLGLLATSLTEGIYFMIYGSTFLVQYPVWARSFVAAFSNSVVTTPLWAMIIWKQALDKEGSSITDSARELYKVRGVYGFFDSLPFNFILCIYPILRQVTYEMILQHCVVTSTGYVSAGSAGTIASIIATITTYPIQKTRISWQVSPRAAMSEVSLGLHAIATCKMACLYDRFFSGIEYKLAHTCIRSFCLFFTMEFIVDVLKGKLVS